MRKRNLPQQVKYSRISLLLLFQFFSVVLLAQVRISGKVTTPDNKGIPDISVLVHNTTTGATTDAEGNYSFTANLKPGSYQLDFSGVGYKASSLPIQVTSSGTVTSNAQLTQDALKMD